MSRQAYMYALTLCQTKGYAKIHVLALELEYTDHDLVFTDFLQAIEALRERGIDHVLIVCDEANQDWADVVDKTLYYCGFDCCGPIDFPE